METDLDVRAPTLIDRPQNTGTAPGVRHWTGRAQNFSVSWTRTEAAATRIPVESPDEILLLVLDAAVAVSGSGGQAQAPARSACILPPGAWQLDLEAGATCTVITSLREGAAAGAINEAAYETRDERIVPVGTPYKALRGAGEIRVFPIDAVQAAPDKPRLKMLQTATLSINWVEYEGPRDRQALSPHAHRQFEQGSLGLVGDFMHHLRVTWGADADAWKDDRHERMGSPSLMVVPVDTIHTSEGVGPGRHLLIDVFSPPRADFIARGWIFNAGDYEAPTAG